MATLRELREQRKISQRSLARELGISATFIGQIEKGVASPNAAMISKLATALEIDEDQLFMLWNVVDPKIKLHLSSMPKVRRAVAACATKKTQSALDKVAANFLKEQNHEQPV